MSWSNAARLKRFLTLIECSNVLGTNILRGDIGFHPISRAQLDVKDETIRTRSLLHAMKLSVIHPKRSDNQQKGLVEGHGDIKMQKQITTHCSRRGTKRLGLARLVFDFSICSVTAGHQSHQLESSIAASVCEWERNER